MATQNLFEKYGIKEVADVTLYRIEKKEETYESQRTISVASVLKGSVELKTVYPMVNGLGSDEGFEAYVFSNADVITGTNYDCDDAIKLDVTINGSFVVTEDGDTSTITPPADAVDVAYSEGGSALETAIVGGFVDSVTTYTASDFTSSIVARNTVTKREVEFEELEDEGYVVKDDQKYNITYTKGTSNVVDGKVTYTVTYTGTADDIVYESEEGDIETGVYTPRGRSESDANKEVGTHEFSYAEQAFMLFAKNQNLIAKTGTRYQFSKPEDLIAGLIFEDAYALAPNSEERVVVLGLESTSDAVTSYPRVNGSWSDANYDAQEVLDTINQLKGSFTAKAYNVVYNLYAELVVEDEMGYYNPKFLGTAYNKATGKIDNIGAANYATFASAGKGIDIAIANATMWGEDEHYSINDAIDALRQQQKLIDGDATVGSTGVKGLFGGYAVTGKEIPAAGTADTDSDYEANYYFTRNGSNVSSGLTSKYSLDAVLEALGKLGAIDDIIGKEVEVDYTVYNKDTEKGGASNRAIYVNSGEVAGAASSFIYLLHNKNYRKISADTEGVFTFTDKKGNKVYYQDKVFAGTEWLALVVIGTKGLIFVVNRHGEKDTSRVAWMVSETGFVTDNDAKNLVTNGLIHTTYITSGDESFEATCSVKSLNVRTTKKTTNHYVPVLFLDTLKVSTIEQTAEEVYATGGRGNANLIGWDYGKEITLSLEDALFTPASLSAAYGSYEGNDFRNGVKDVKQIDRMEKVIAKRSFIVPAGNQNGTPTEADKSAQAVFIDPNTMEPYADGTPIAEGETFLKFTRSIAYEGQSIGNMIEISADKFPGTYKVVGDTYIRSKDTGEDQRFQFVIPQAKMQSEQTITLEADGDPVVFDFNMTVLRPDDGVMVRFIQYDVVDNEEENDGSTMVKNTENLNLLDDAELFKVSSGSDMDEDFIGATEY